MKAKPKNAMSKRNHRKICFSIQQPILRMLREKHYSGGIIGLLSDEHIVNIAKCVTDSVMKNEDIGICLKRSKRC